MSRRESYSFSNVAVEKDTPRLSRKYHIVEMKITGHSVSDDGSVIPHYCALDWNERFRHERLLPDVFSADGCPVRVYLINDFHDAVDEPVACFGFGTAVLNVLVQIVLRLKGSLRVAVRVKLRVIVALALLLAQ